MQCNNCHHPLLEEDQFCPYCGQEIIQQPTPQPVEQSPPQTVQHTVRPASREPTPRWLIAGGIVLLSGLCFGVFAVGGTLLLTNQNQNTQPAVSVEANGSPTAVPLEDAAPALPQEPPAGPQMAAPPSEQADQADQPLASAVGVKAWLDTSLAAEYRVVPPQELGGEKSLEPLTLALETQNPTGMILILPVKEYSTLIGDSRAFEELQNAISFGADEDLEVCIPIPLTPCDEQVFNFQVEKLAFQNGTGIRAASAFIEDNAIAFNNESMDYHFYGLTADQQFYIYASYDLDHEYLPESDWVFKLGEADIDVFDEVFANVHQQLTQTGGYSPGMASIDAVIQSLRVTGE